MPARSPIKRMPVELRQELNRKILQDDFETLDTLSEWTKEKGFPVSSSTLHRHKQKLVGSTALPESHEIPQDPAQMTHAALAEEYAALMVTIHQVNARQLALESEIVKRHFHQARQG